MATEGTGNTAVLGAPRVRSDSQEAKKKVLSFRIGPPILAPNWFRLKGGTERAKKLRESNTLLRRNSYALPWKELVPDLMTAFTVAPRLRPYSALLELVITENSWRASGLGKGIGEL